MTSLILCHLVNSIMDRIKVGSLGSLCYIHLTCTCTTFCLGTLLQISLGVPDNIAYQLSETTCVVCLLESIALEAALASLGERESAIINMRFFRGKTQMEIAEEIGISQAQVSRIEKSALERMRKAIN